MSRALLLVGLALAGCVTEFERPALSGPSPDEGVSVDGAADATAPPPDAELDLDAGEADAMQVIDARVFPDVPPLPDVTVDADIDAACVQAPEVCNGRDDDCDGRVDVSREAVHVCGEFIQERCTFWLGLSIDRVAPRGADPETTCGEAQTDDGPFRCVAAPRDETFGLVFGERDLGPDDRLVVGFSCEGGLDATWIEARCALYLGHGPAGATPMGPVPTWGSCPGDADGDGDLPCASTGKDGRLHGLTFANRLAPGQPLAAAFACDDPNNPERAAATTESVEVFIGWVHESNRGLDQLGVADGMVRWDGCPGADIDDTGALRCVGTAADGLFRAFPIGDGSQPSRKHVFSIMVRPAD